MGNIVKKAEDFNYLKNLIVILNDLDITKDTIEEILIDLIPKDNDGNPLIKINVREKGNVTAIFYPKYESIHVCINQLKNWIEFNSKDLASYYGIENSDLFKNYLLLMVLTHEVEHSYQYLIGKEVVPTSCKMLQQGYKCLSELMVPKDYILPRPIKQVRRVISVISYKRRENEFLLERNAQYDSLSLISSLAISNGHDDIAGIFNNMKNTFAIAGYTKNCDGTLINTMKDIFMGDKLKKFEHDYESLDMNERFRLGLPIDEKTRSRVLALK